MLLLVPADPLNARRCDEHFADEMAAARQAGWPTALVNVDALLNGRAAAAVAAVPANAGRALLRSWMLPSGQYAELEQALAAKGAALITDAEQYRRAHELPGWHAAFATLTAPSVWVGGPDLPALADAAAALPAGAGIAKDFVKSAKHRFLEACYVPDVHDRSEVLRVAGALVALRERELQGGLVLRAHQQLTGSETRSWWAAGRCAALSAHPDTPQDLAASVPVERAAGAVAALGCPLICVDWAQDADGEWQVVEVGDGQVSDRPRTMTAAALIAVLGALDGSGA